MQVPIDQKTFNLLLSQTISRYIRRGIPRSEAVQRAHEVVGNAFIIKDYDNEPSKAPQVSKVQGV